MLPREYGMLTSNPMMSKELLQNKKSKKKKNKVSKTYFQIL